jgi:hypothetical protein
MAMIAKKHTKGTILLVCLILSVLLLGLVAASAALAHASNGWFSHIISQTELVGLAEAATELRQKQLLDEIANFADDGVLLADRTHAIPKGGETIDVTSRVTRKTIAGDEDNEILVTDPDGVSVFVSYYDVVGEATLHSDTTQVTRTIQVGRTPLFQFAVFYDDDLEILPGPNMTLAGRVHANGDMYLNCGGTLTIDSSYLRCTGEIFRGRKNSAAAPGGTVSIRNDATGAFATLPPDKAPAERWNGGTADPVYYDNYGSDPNNWVDHSEATWGDTVQTQAHGVKEIAAPSIQTMQPGGYYHSKAGIVIEHAGGRLKVLERLESGVVNDITTDLPVDTVITHGFYDARESQAINVVDVDMEKLRDSGHLPHNGLVYAYRTDTTETSPHGVIFKNGKELAQPTFIVTPDPVYLQGDFNAPDAGSGFTKQASVVMSDAINVLSNSWDGTKRSGSGLPKATPTTVNTAMVSGIVRTPDIPDGTYSGGLENYPRFHENWSGVELKMRGSFNCLFQSTFARGTWRYGNPVYTAPVRNWGFDPDLLNHHSSFLKDLIPFAVTIRRLAWDDSLESRLQ